jgi:hypothetical protein
VFDSASGLSTIDLKTGQVSPFGSGITTPNGLLFVPAVDGHGNDQDQDQDQHHDR